MPDHATPLIIGVAGGTGSGKTTLATLVVERIGASRIAFLPHDAYYKDQGALPLDARGKLNYDHPDSLDTPLMVEHLRDLRAYRPVEAPIYDFRTHTRSVATRRIVPQPVILVEGILIFAEPDLRALFDVKLFVDTDPDIRFIRRLQRDIQERGRTPESVVEQYLATVRPMHLEFVEPSKRYADIIIPEGGLNTVAMDMVVARLEAMLQTETAA